MADPSREVRIWVFDFERTGVVGKDCRNVVCVYCNEVVHGAPEAPGCCGEVHNWECGDDGKLCPECFDKGGDEMTSDEGLVVNANARLNAAAPDLLANLVKAHAWIEALLKEFPLAEADRIMKHMPNNWRGRYDMADAIARATGEAK